MRSRRSISARGVQPFRCRRLRVHTCAVLDDGSVKCWGRNLAGELGLGDQADRGTGCCRWAMGFLRSTSAQAAPQSKWWRHLGGRVRCSTTNGEVLGRNNNPASLARATGSIGRRAKCRGAPSGEMGDLLPPIDFGAGRSVIYVDSGGSTSCALLDNAEVKCWGRNSVGQLGLGDTTSRGDQSGEMGDHLPPSISVLGGRPSRSALLATAHVRCSTMRHRSWGYNFNGELGLGDKASRGDQPGQMGDALATVDSAAAFKRLDHRSSPTPAAPTSALRPGPTGCQASWLSLASA